MNFQSVAVVGLGLMGGSLAHDLARRSVRVFGYDRSDEVVQQAIDAGTVHHRIDALDQIGPVDLVVVATPVDTVVELLQQIERGMDEPALVTDLGSTKAHICSAAADMGMASRFIGSHPLAGDHRSGWESARPGLYQGATVFLSSSTLKAGDSAVEAISSFWKSLGARPVLIGPEEHDRRMAWISHLPQVVATALASVLSAEEYSPADLGPGGRDMTRLAGSSPEMWAAIATANSENVRVAVEQLQLRLSSFQQALDDPDSGALVSFFRNGRSWLG